MMTILTSTGIKLIIFILRPFLSPMAYFFNTEFEGSRHRSKIVVDLLQFVQ